MNVTPAVPIAGAATEATAAILVVLQPVARDPSSVLRDHAIHFLQTLLECGFGAVQFGGTLKYAVRKIREVFLHPGDAQIQIHLVVVRGDVVVTDGPVFSISVAALGLEIIVGEPEREPPPDIRLAAQAARANPRVVG